MVVEVERLTWLSAADDVEVVPEDSSEAIHTLCSVEAGADNDDKAPAFCVRSEKSHLIEARPNKPSRGAQCYSPSGLRLCALVIAYNAMTALYIRMTAVGDRGLRTAEVRRCGLPAGAFAPVCFPLARLCPGANY